MVQELHRQATSQPHPCVLSFLKYSGNPLSGSFTAHRYFRLCSIGHFRPQVPQSSMGWAEWRGGHRTSCQRLGDSLGFLVFVGAPLPGSKFLCQPSPGSKARGKVPNGSEGFVMEMLTDPSAQWHWQVLPQYGNIIQSSFWLTSRSTKQLKCFMNRTRTPEIQLRS